MTTDLPLPPPDLSLGEQLRGIINRLPEDGVSLGSLLDVFGDEGLLRRKAI